MDRKGRVAIPSALRTVLEANTPREEGVELARSVVIAPHETERCLIGYDELYTAQLLEELKGRTGEVRLPGAAPDQSLALGSMGMAEPTLYDASGRFVLLGWQREEAKIGDVAMFIATGDVFEIWNPELLLASPRSNETLKRMIRYQLDNRKKEA